jgi:hypothetical protein
LRPNDENLLVRSRLGNRKNPLLLLPFHNKVKRMVVVRAILFTGIAGCALGKNHGILSVEKMAFFFRCCHQIQVQVLAFHQTIDGFTLIADFLFIF